MGQDMMSGAFGVFISLLVLVLLVLWFFLPFAVFGIKDRLDKLIEQNRQLISLMESRDIDPGSSHHDVPATRNANGSGHDDKQ